MCRGAYILSFSAAAALMFSSLAFGGLQRLDPESLIVIYATQEGATALDCVDAKCSSGPVAKALASALVRDVTIAGLFDAINADVAATSNGTQRPRISASESINVPLVKNAGHATALVIGNGQYRDLPRLVGSSQDPHIVGDSLNKIGFKTKIAVDVTLPDLMTAIDDFVKQLGEDDTAVFYYSGHGFWAEGQNYLAGVEAETKSPMSGSLAVSALASSLSRSKAARKILILDTHFPNVAPRSNR